MRFSLFYFAFELGTFDMNSLFTPSNCGFSFEKINAFEEQEGIDCILIYSYNINYKHQNEQNYTDD